MKRNLITNGKLVLAGLIGAYSIIMTLASPITFMQGAAFFLFQILGMLLPGMALLRFLQVPDMDDMECTVWGYALGYILNIVQYFLLASCGCLNWMRVVQIICAVFAIIYLIVSHKNKSSDEMPEVSGRVWIPLAVMLIIVLGIRYVTYYGMNLLPSAVQDVTFPTQDLLFYIGNAISAEKGFPVQEFRYAGEVFKYHYFGSIQLAVEALATGIDALSLEFCLAWMQGSLLVVSTFWCLLRRMKITQSKCVLGMVLLLFTTGWELLVYVAFQHKMYQSPFGWDIGMAFGILTLTFAYIQYQEQKYNKGVWLLLILSFAVCEGAKAPIAVIILLVLGCICATWLLEKGKRAWAFLYGIPLVLVFLVIFFVFVSDGMNTVTTNSTGLRIDLTGHLYECGLGKLYFDWTAQGMPGIIGKVLIFVLFFAGCNLATYCLLAVVTLLFVKKSFRNVISFEGSLIVGTCAGLLFTLLTKQSGNSQMYFAMSAFPLAVIASMKLWNEGYVPSGVYGKKLFNVTFTVLLVLSVFGCVKILQPSWQYGIEKLSGKNDFEHASNSLTYEELEGYTWVRENTESNAMCITNVILDDEQYQSFIVGASTERQMYIEGWRYVIGTMDEAVVYERRNQVRALLSGDVEARDAALDAGVDYVLWAHRYGSIDEKVEGVLGPKLYDNGAVAVYQMKME